MRKTALSINNNSNRRARIFAPRCGAPVAALLPAFSRTHLGTACEQPRLSFAKITHNPFCSNDFRVKVSSDCIYKVVQGLLSPVSEPSKVRLHRVSELSKDKFSHFLNLPR